LADLRLKEALQIQELHFEQMIAQCRYTKARKYYSQSEQTRIDNVNTDLQP
jgi:hypothetical protein